MEILRTHTKLDPLDDNWDVPLCELIDKFGREMNRKRFVFSTAVWERQFWIERQLEFVYGIGNALRLLKEEPDEVDKASNRWPFKQGQLGASGNQNQPKTKQATLGPANSGWVLAITEGLYICFDGCSCAS